MAREMNTKEVVRWLNEMEARYARLRVIAIVAILTADGPPQASSHEFREFNL